MKEVMFDESETETYLTTFTVRNDTDGMFMELEQTFTSKVHHFNNNKEYEDGDCWYDCVSINASEMRKLYDMLKVVFED